MIDPGTNPAGETVESYCRRRWGGSGWTRHLISEGQRDGARFENWQWWPHTLKAHQLVEYCGSNNICSTDKVNQVLFRAQYENGKNISQTSSLMELAKTELNVHQELEKSLETFLNDDLGKDQVKQEINTGRRRYKISGVPFFVIGKDDDSRPYGFSGAQKSDTFLDLFEELSS